MKTVKLYFRCSINLTAFVLLERIQNAAISSDQVMLEAALSDEQLQRACVRYGAIVHEQQAKCFDRRGQGGSGTDHQWQIKAFQPLRRGGILITGTYVSDAGGGNNHTDVLLIQLDEAGKLK